MTSISQSFERAVSALLAELPLRARSIVKRRYGLGEKEAWTLEGIGRKEGITRERVRQIESDALLKLKKSKAFALLKKEEEAIADIMRKYGGMIAEPTLFALSEFAGVKDKRILAFFLDLCDSVIRRKESDDFYVRWQVKGVQAGKIEEALTGLARELRSAEKTCSKDEVLAKLASYLKKYGADSVKSPALETCLAISKQVGANAWGEYGHVESPFVRPKGMREGAYVALARAGRPLHFKEIATHIQTFSPKRVHIQTVHNELIKDRRFVLVGRGLYGLEEWGYQPGFIRDVLVRMLKERGAMAREAILEEIKKHRQVKAATVLINLQNKKLFTTNEDGHYTLIS